MELEKIKPNRFQPKKSLGQNYLIDRNILNKIANALDCTNADIIIEIGSGHGSLTESLLNCKPGFLYSIEIDRNSIDILQEKFPKKIYPNFSIIHSDIRDINLIDLMFKHQNHKALITGNIPYNISSDILFWIFGQAGKIKKAVLTMQKEVAQRMCAKPKTKQYGILTVAMNYIGKSKILFDINPKCFYPVPKVLSSVVEIVPDKDGNKLYDFNKVMALVKQAFNQRRKQLRNSLDSYFSSIGIDLKDFFACQADDYSAIFTKRAEELTVNDYITLYNLITNYSSSINGGKN